MLFQKSRMGKGPLSKNESSNSSSTSPFKVTKILVPVDGSPNSRLAAEAASSLAKTYRASLVFLNVIPTPKFTYGSVAVLGAPSSIGLDEYYRYAETEAQSLVDRFVREAKDAKLEAGGEIVKSSESTVQSIVDQAKDLAVDLIVIGSRGLSSFRKMIIGSVSSGVVTYAQCPVLVVR
jgi:nucleotide-binding universal stress UspA family protein